MDLSKKRCKPCEGGIAPLDQYEIAEYKKHIVDGWEVRDNNKISKEVVFVNYHNDQLIWPTSSPDANTTTSSATVRGATKTTGG